MKSDIIQYSIFLADLGPMFDQYWISTALMQNNNLGIPVMLNCPPLIMFFCFDEAAEACNNERNTLLMDNCASGFKENAKHSLEKCSHKVGLRRDDFFGKCFI